MNRILISLSIFLGHLQVYGSDPQVENNQTDRSGSNNEIYCLYHAPKSEMNSIKVGIYKNQADTIGNAFGTAFVETFDTLTNLTDKVVGSFPIIDQANQIITTAGSLVLSQFYEIKKGQKLCWGTQEYPDNQTLYFVVWDGKKSTIAQITPPWAGQLSVRQNHYFCSKKPTAQMENEKKTDKTLKHVNLKNTMGYGTYYNPDCH